MTQITQTRFEGLQAVELKTAALRLVAVAAYGPRLASLGTARGENILLWQPKKYTRKDWDLRGGHRVWVTRPGADECEDTYASDNGPCDVKLTKDGFCLTGAENPVNHTRRGIAVKILAADRLAVDNFVTNTSNMLYSGGVWVLTCTVPSKGTRYAIPLGDGSSWDAFNLVMFRTWAGHGQGGFNDRQISFTDDLLLLEPRGVENKRMLQAPRGIIAMSDPTRKLTFAKQVNYDPAGHYPLGTNLAFYVGPKNFMVELETMGPEHTLKPGQSLHHRETWVLKPGAVKLDQAERLVKLFA